MMKIIQQIFIKRWKPILEEYEKIPGVRLHNFTFSSSIFVLHFVNL